MTRITIETQLSEKDFTKAAMYLLYRQFAVRLLSLLGLLLWLLFILYAIVSLVQGLTSVRDLPWSFLIYGVLLAVLLPAMTYLRVKRAFRANARIQERITYGFDETNIYLTGESFSSQLTWDKIYAVTETKEMILIHTTRYVANVIPKHFFGKVELDAFKTLVRNQKTLRKKLKD